MRLAQSWMLLLVLAGVGSVASAQDEPDFENPGIDAGASPAWRPFYELLLRGDRVTGLPGGREDLERVRGRVRAGGEWSPDGEDAWLLGAALEGAIGTGANKRSLVNNDIEDVDGFGLDQLWLRRRLGDGPDHLQIGKAPLPLTLTPMLWDDDLRPVGAHAALGGSWRDFDRWSVVFGVFEPDPLDVEGPGLRALQLGWETPAFGGGTFGLQLAYLDWTDLGAYGVAGLARGNSFSTRFRLYTFDYRLLDARAYLRTRVGEKTLEASFDRVTNLDADAADDGTRASLVWGDRFDPGQPGWELGWAWQRIQRDAVLAAVTADDWWFHTAARGHMPWVGYGFRGGWSVRAAAFFETRDGLEERTRRLVLDLEARW